MRIPFFFRRDNTQCAAGLQYYTCAASNYKGCCSVDACDYDDGCPDASATATGAKKTSSPAVKSTSAESPPSTTVPPKTTSSSKTTSTSTSSSSSTSVQGTSSSSSTSSITSGSSTAAPPAEETDVSGNTGNQAASHGLSKGAIGGIVTAGVIAFVILFCLVLWRMRRHNKELKEAAESALAAATAEGRQPPNGGTVFPQPSPSPANPSGTPHLDEKFASLNVSQRESLLANDANYTMNAKFAELQGNSPASTTIPLFGEAPAGNTEEAIARWGLHGARMMAQHRTQQQALAMAQGDTVADYGGGYMGPGSEAGMVPQPLQVVASRISELDGQQPAVVAELETPQLTPQPTPMSTPGLGSYSPSLSVGSSHASRSTMVSPWRNSSRTLGSDVNTIAEEGGPNQGSNQYLQPSPIPSPNLHPPNSPSRSGSMAEPPRATLDLSQTERRRGVNVASWGSYNP